LHFRLFSNHQDALKSELKKSIPFASIVFDGATDVAECYGVVIRLVIDGYIQHRILRVKLLKKAVDSDELMSIITVVLCTDYGIDPASIVAAINDRASVNRSAYEKLKPLLSRSVSVGCFSHTLNNAGEKLEMPLLRAFMTAWNQIHGHSLKAKDLFMTYHPLCVTR
jgi:hypothetical protein